MIHETTISITFPTGDRARYIVTCTCGWQTADTLASGASVERAAQRHRAQPVTPREGRR